MNYAPQTGIIDLSIDFRYCFVSNIVMIYQALGIIQELFYTDILKSTEYGIATHKVSMFHIQCEI